MVCKISPITTRKNDSIVAVLYKIIDKYNYEGIEYPTSYEDIYNFEKINKICIYAYEIHIDKIIKAKEGLAEYILNDTIYVLRIENNEHHIIYT